MHYLEKHHSEHKYKNREQEEKKRHLREFAPPTPPSGPSSRPTIRNTLEAEWEADEREAVPCCTLRVDLVDGDCCIYNVLKCIKV